MLFPRALEMPCNDERDPFTESLCCNCLNLYCFSFVVFLQATPKHMLKILDKTLVMQAGSGNMLKVTDSLARPVRDLADCS